QLGHEVRFRVKPAGGVHDQDLRAAGLRRLHRVEGHRRGIGPGPLAHDRDVDPLAPALELVDGRRAERVARAQDDGVPVLAEPPRELAAGGRLAGAVDADDEHDRGLGIEVERRSGAGQRLAEMVPQRAPRIAVGEASGARLLPDLLHECFGGVETEIGLKEQRLELLDRVALELLALEDAREAVLERRPRLAEPFPQAIGEARKELHGEDSPGRIASFTTWPAVPSAGSARPSSSSSTPPALPRVTWKRPEVRHSRTAPGASVSSVAGAPSGWTRIHVVSVARITSTRSAGFGALDTGAAGGAGAIADVDGAAGAGAGTATGGCGGGAGRVDAVATAPLPRLAKASGWRRPRSANPATPSTTPTDDSAATRPQRRAAETFGASGLCGCTLSGGGGAACSS